MFSLRGTVTDYGEEGRFERNVRTPPSAIRPRSAGHDVTESAPINSVWAGIKHGLLFAVAHTGLVD